MATAFKDEFIDGLLDQGRAEGEARGRAEGRNEGRSEGRAEGEAAMLLRVLAARGFAVPDDVQQRVRSCTDIAQLETWGDRAVTAKSLDEIFTA
jgi:predicted transposase YdaD